MSEFVIRLGQEAGGLNEAFQRDLVALVPRLRRFAYGLTGSVDDGDDLVQHACERALSRSHQWQPGTKLDSWMYRIVQNLWFDHCRAGRHREMAVDDNVLAAVPGGDLSAEVENRLALAAVRRIVANLPEDQRSVLMLVTVEGASYKEAAKILDVPIGTVMSRLARARLAVGRVLNEEKDSSRVTSVAGSGPRGEGSW